MPNSETVSDREKWEAEVRLRERELGVKEREASIRERDQARSRWTNPLVIGIFAAILAAVGNGVVAWVNGSSQQDIEETRAEAARILGVINTDPDTAAENLSFLLDAGLISSDGRKKSISEFLEKRKPGQGPSLSQDPGGSSEVAFEESRLNSRDIMGFQRVVCLPPDGIFGPATRSRVLKYLRENNLKDPSSPDKLTSADVNALKDALESGPKC